MNLRLAHARALTRREFLSTSGRLSLGALTLNSLLGRAAVAGHGPLAPHNPPLPAHAKAVIYLSMSGAPPQHDLFDYKPALNQRDGEPCPDEFLNGQTFAFIKGKPRLLGSPFKFKQYGAAGGWVSDALPHFTKIVDDVAVIRSMTTDQFNHAPAELFFYTGNMRAGSASIGSWLTYGLGSENQDLPGFVVLLSGGVDPTGGKS